METPKTPAYLYVINKSTMIQEIQESRAAGEDKRNLDFGAILDFFEDENEDYDVQGTLYWQPLDGWHVGGWPAKAVEIGWDFKIPADGLAPQQMTAGQRMEVSACMLDVIFDVEALIESGTTDAKFIFIAHTLELLPVIKYIEAALPKAEIEVWVGDHLKDGGMRSKYFFSSVARVRDWSEIDRHES